MIRQKTEEKYRSYIGQKFDKLTIKDFIYNKNINDYHERSKFLCDCDCGIKDKLITCNNIIYSNQKSCGCIKRTIKIRSKTEEKYRSYIGQKFGKLTITDFVYDPSIHEHKRYFFLCNCDCGIEDKLIRCVSIISGDTRSCGCIRYIKTGPKFKTEEKYRSHIGQKFGKLTITDFVYDPSITYYEGKYNFLCDCDCGTKDKLINCHEVLRKGQNGCGCGNNGVQLYTEEKYRSYIGQKFGKLTITDFVYDEVFVNPSQRYNFICDCECGTKDKIIPCVQILNKHQITCGCEISSTEYIISNFLQKNNIKFEKRRIQSIGIEQQKVEIDFLISNIGIELHGLNTHATIYDFKEAYLNNMFIGDKLKIYHLNKLESAKAQNIDLLQFWNTELYQKFEIVKSIILNRLNKTEHSEYARKCYVKEIEKSTSDNFLLLHHIQGSVRNDSVRLGLFHKKTDNLVSVMTFGTARFSEHEWELYRFATYINCRVVGAASKLFKYFIRNYNPSSIVSYSDRRLFNSGKLYSTLGFKLDHISAPNYWYFKRTESEHNARLYHRVQFQKHKLSKILGVFDSNLTEWQNMENNNYLRIYDCGNKVYVYNV